MTFKDSLYAYLISIGPLTQLVSERIYPDRAEDNVQSPYIVFRVSIRPYQTMDAKPPYVDAIVDATAFDTSPEGAQLVAQQLGAEDGTGALSHFPQGIMGGGVTVLHSTLLEQQPEDADDFGLFGVRSTFELSYAT